MRTDLKQRIAKFVLWTICMLFIASPLKAEDKYKARLSVDYVSVMNETPFISVNVKYKGEDGYAPATEQKLNVYQQINEDSLAFVGETATDHKGNAEFALNVSVNLTDSIDKFEYLIKIEDDPKFKDAKKSLKFSLSTLNAEAIVVDSVNYISATLTDAYGQAIEGEKLRLELKRLFAPLRIGDSSYETDDDGNVMIELTDTMPGVDGVLTFVVSMDTKKYGIVKNIFEAPIGKVIVDQSTFDDRTMWSPQNKTPIFLLIFPNLIILGIWFVIGLLVFNLIKIYKS